MSLDYDVYYLGEKEELEKIINDFLSVDQKGRFFSPAIVSNISKVTQEILLEMGYSAPYRSSAFLQIRKEFTVEATLTLKLLRDTVLPQTKALFLLNGETELSV